MTAREKLALEHPEEIGPMFCGGYCGCPSKYGYLSDPDWCGTDNEPPDKCTVCWNREIPGTEGIHVGTLITEKESNTMEKKTKAQLIEEINANMRDIHELKKELEKLDKYRKYEEAANELYAAYEAMVNAGFTREQAWELFMSTAKVSLQAAVTC